MSELLLAILAPFLMVILFTRVTYSLYISTFLTIVIIVAIFQGYSEPFYVVVFWIVSLILGFLYSKRMMKGLKKKTK